MSNLNQKTLVVGLGAIQVSNNGETIVKTLALGSCVAIIIALPRYRTAAMAHVVLPDSNIDPSKAGTRPGYFADTAVPEMLNQLRKLNILNLREATVKLVGGANVMDTNSTFNIGKRNVLAIRKALWKNRLAPLKEDVEGSISRTVWVEAGSGRVFINSPGRGQWEL